MLCRRECDRQMRGTPMVPENVLPGKLMPSRMPTAFLLSGLSMRALETEIRTRIMNLLPKQSVRCRAGNANHHLWNNHGTWWCHLTLHFPDFTKERLRLSLDTHDLNKARQLRDALLALFGLTAAV